MMRLNELTDVKPTEQSLKHSHHYPSSAVCNFLGGLVCLVFSLYTLSFQNTGEKYRLLSPQALSMVLSRSWLLPALWLELWESFTFLWHFDTVQNYWSEVSGNNMVTQRILSDQILFSPRKMKSHSLNLDTEEPSVENQDPQLSSHFCHLLSSYSFLCIYFWLLNCVIILFYTYILFLTFILY